MEPRRTLLRRAGMAGAVLLLLSVVTACGGTGPIGATPVATVDGHRIYQDEVLDLADAQAAYVEAQRTAAVDAKKEAKAAGESTAAAEDAIERLDGVLKSYRGLTLDTASASEIVGSLVEIEILSGVVREAGQEIKQADRDENRESLLAELEQQQITDAEPFDALITVEIERKLLYEKVQELASSPSSDEDEAKLRAAHEADLRAAYEENADMLEELCVRLVATEDQAAAQAAYDRVVAGEDFSSVAAEVSIDETSAPGGGDIGCVPRANIAGVFGDAAVTAKAGDLLPPADGEGSWLFIQVDDINMPTFEEAQEVLAQMVPDNGQVSADNNEAAAQELLIEAFANAEVSIDPRYGTWDPNTASVTPPVDPAPTTTAADLMLDPGAMDPAGADPAGP